MSGKRAREVQAENATLVAWARTQFEDVSTTLQALRFARAFRKAKHTIDVYHRVKGAGKLRVRRVPVPEEGGR